MADTHIGELQALSFNDAGLLTGRVDVPIEVDSQRLDVFVDDRLVDTLYAAMPLGRTPDADRHWLGFDYSLSGMPLASPARLDVRHVDGTVLGGINLARRAPRKFDTEAALRHWLFHHRFLSGPDFACNRQIFEKWEAEASEGLGAPAQAPPRVSIVMPVFQPDGFLFRAIASVLSQTWQNWELIIIDDGSVVFPSLATALQDERVRFYRVARNIGQSAIRNLGLSLSSGDAIAFLDSDCRWAPTYLEVMVHALHRHGDADAVYCGQTIVDADGQIAGLRAGDFHPSLIDNENFVDINCLMVRRDALEAIGGFDQRLRALEDWDLVRRLSEMRSPVWVKANLSTYVRNRPVSVSASGLPRLHWPDIVAKLQKNVLTKDIGERTFRFDLGDEQPRSARKVSIVIPSYNVPEVLETCVDRLVDSIDTYHNQIIICDNGSDAETQACLDRLSETYPFIDIVRSSENMGFTWAANQGIARARPGNDIVLLNNDAIVTHGWLEALQAVPRTMERAGLVVPRQILPPGTHTIGHHAPAANLNHETDVNLSWHHGNVILRDDALHDACLQLSFAPFFCVYITRRLLDAIGPLSMESGKHYHSDTDYCARARQAGWDVVYTARSRVYHLLQVSTKDLSRRMTGDFDRLFA